MTQQKRYDVFSGGDLTIPFRVFYRLFSIPLTSGIMSLQRA